MTGGGVGRAIRWPLWSWRNLAITTVAVLVVFAALGRLTGGSAPASDNSTAASTPPASNLAGREPTVPATVPHTSPATTSTAPTSTSTTAPATSASTGRSPVKVATAFVTAWTHTTGGEAQWIDGMKP